MLIVHNERGFPGGTSGKEPACECKRHKRQKFIPQVGKISWRRAWQPTPVFLPGESHGQRSLVEYSPQSRKELDTTEVTVCMHVVHNTKRFVDYFSHDLGCLFRKGNFWSIHYDEMTAFMWYEQRAMGAQGECIQVCLGEARTASRKGITQAEG